MTNTWFLGNKIEKYSKSSAYKRDVHKIRKNEEV